MAGAAGLVAALAPAHLILQDVRRNRELYRYLQPINLSAIPPTPRRTSSTSSAVPESPNLTAALAPFVQLAALRCDAVTAMLNVMDRDKMYFLAQASKRPSNAPDTMPMFETSEDGVWMGCSSVPLEGRVCEITLRMPRDPHSKQYPMFVVQDLSKDSRFSDLDVVKSGPCYRFYAGTPIVTHNGVNIGSLAVLDTQPREGLGEDEERCLGQTAAHIMSYLELNRQAIEGRRARRMGQGLNRFVAGKRSLESRSAGSQNLKREKPINFYGVPDPVPDSDEEEELESPRNTAAHQRKTDSIDHRSETSSLNEPDDKSREAVAEKEEETADVEESVSRSHGKTFARAANLLRECLEVDDDGGVVFTVVPEAASTSSNTFGIAIPKPKVEGGSASTSDEPSPEKRARDRSVQIPHTPKFFDRSQSTPAPILACSTLSDPLVEGEGTQGRKLPRVDVDALSYFLSRFPGGRLWSLDDNDVKSSSSETSSVRRHSSGDKKSSRSRRKWIEHDYLRRTFPEARQLLMMPLWDGSQGRISSACFVWTSSESRSFSTRTDLGFLTAFSQTLMAECSRIDAIMADKQKSDFVGTISHEMRSPLHGILASVEFLTDSDMSSFQRSLIETVGACGRTLLDTINHVLDFSKINSFEKNWQAANAVHNEAKSKRRSHPPEPFGDTVLSTAAPPLLQLFGATDISAVLEEVVEGIAVGQIYTSNIDITDTSRAARGRGGRMESIVPDADAVEVILDIEPNDWVFMTQPGAVRRVIMNIFGNAMKYTSNGSIKVKLKLKELENSNADRTMQLTVTDTGKGISPRFLASRLFVPFAQENALAPGTGLGLSICKSIINMLGGSIDVRSRVNSGTTVHVNLPLQRPLPGNVSTQNTPHSNTTSTSSIISAPDASIPVIKEQAIDSRVALYGFFEANPLLSKGELGIVLQKYVEEWYDIDVVSPYDGTANVIIVEEQDMRSLLRHHPVPTARPALIVLCSDASSHSRAVLGGSERFQAGVVEYIAKPCGPYKLARALRACLERSKVLYRGKLDSFQDGSTPMPPAMKSEISNGLQELSVGTPGGNATSTMVQASEGFAASQTSQNAQMAITSPGLRDYHKIEDEGSFPFPTLERGKLEHAANQSLSNASHLAVPNGSPSKGLTHPTLAPVSPAGFRSPPPTLKKVGPRVLLVDDNKINLKLLQTFLVKRNYSHISLAEDGQIAVNTATTTPEPFEIIFMDISMPILNGFEATRAIRDFEEKNHIANGAMIIALTGLASGRDQSEGFAAGCDIYMTKPVSFKEVGKLLDNWEAHQTLKLDHSEEAIVSSVGGAVTENGMADTAVAV